MTTSTDTLDRGTGTRPTRMRIRVVDHDRSDNPAVDVTLPLGLVRFGLKMAKSFSPEIKDVDIDWDALAAAIDAGERGQIVHVDDEAKHQTVDVYVE